MKQKKLRILFMGSPGFASACLDQLIEDQHQVVAVITGPDRKKGRGQQLAESEVKISAKKHDIPIFQPTNLKDPIFLNEIKALKIDLGVVVAFRMLPEALWNMPELGTINLHASLLPNYRGAAPINWAIINGEKRTGLTTFFLKHEIDTGDVILREEVPIAEDMNAGALHDLLMKKGAELLSQSVQMIEKDEFKIIEQSNLNKETQPLKIAPKIFKKDCKIDWEKSCKDVYNLIRGLSPYPAAWSNLLTKSGKAFIFKVYKAKPTSISCKETEQKVRIDEQGNLLVATGDFYIQLEVIQLEGKKRMPVQDFLKGFDMNETSII